MLQLAWPWFATGLVLPLLVVRALPAGPEPGVALRIPFFDTIPDTPTGASRLFRRIAILLASLAWLALVLAACRPQWVEQPLGVPITGRSMLLALDVSGSMQETAIRAAHGAGDEMSRLQAVQRSARKFIEGRVGDRLGLIVFGSAPYVQSPLTFDRTTVARMIDEVRVGLAGDLTSLGDAIGLAVKQLRTLPDAQRTLVLFTDGANTSGLLSPLDAARLARHHGIRVYTVAVGAHSAQIPGGADHELLQRIASLTAGRYFLADDAAALARVYSELDVLEPVARGEQRFRPVSELYVWPLAMAAFLACMVLLSIAQPGIVERFAKRFARPRRQSLNVSPGVEDSARG